MKDASWSDLLELIAEDVSIPEGSRSEAWAELRRRVEALARVVRRGISALSDEDAEDIVQQVILQMKENRATLTAIRDATAPNAYLLRVVRNAAIDMVRRTQRLTPLQDNATSTLEQSDAAVDIHAAMERLSPDERELVVMRFWEGRSLAQIARAKQLPYSTVAKRFFRLMSRLREQMSETQ